MSNTQTNYSLQVNSTLLEKIHCYLTTATRPTLSSFCAENTDFIKQSFAGVRSWEIILVNEYKNECTKLKKRYRKGDWKNVREQINVDGLAGVSDHLHSTSNTKRLSETQRKTFVNSYYKMDSNKKWKIGEKYVEDIMFEVGSQMEYEHAVHSWIFDPLDEIYEEYLDNDDLDRLTELTLPNNPEVEALLNKLASCKTAKDVEEMAKNNTHSWNEEFDLWWILRTVQEVILLFKTNKMNHLSNEGSEADLVGRVWSLFDPLFEYYGFTCTRPERATVATESTVNSSYTVTGGARSQKFACPLPDLIISKDGYEYGCAEYGKEDRKGINLKEAAEGSIKLSKEMKNITQRLISRINREDEEKMKKVKSVGFLCSRLRMNCSIMDQPCGFVCRLLKLEEVEIPSTIDDLPAKLSQALDVVWKLKETMKQVEDIFVAKERKQATIVRKRKGKKLPSNINNLKQFKRFE